MLKVIDNDTKIISYLNIINIFESLENDEIDKAIIIIENSMEGSVAITLDALTHFDLKIKNEFEI